MLHGRVVRPATVNSKPASVDESSIDNIPGIVKVVQQRELSSASWRENRMGRHPGRARAESHLVRRRHRKYLRPIAMSFTTI